MFGSFVSEATTNMTETCNFKPELGPVQCGAGPGRAGPGLGSRQGTSTVGEHEKATSGCFSHINVCLSLSPPPPPRILPL